MIEPPAPAKYAARLVEYGVDCVDSLYLIEREHLEEVGMKKYHIHLVLKGAKAEAAQVQALEEASRPTLATPVPDIEGLPAQTAEPIVNHGTIYKFGDNNGGIYGDNNNNRRSSPAQTIEGFDAYNELMLKYTTHPYPSQYLQDAYNTKRGQQHLKKVRSRVDGKEHWGLASNDHDGAEWLINKVISAAAKRNKRNPWKAEKNGSHLVEEQEALLDQFK